MRNLGIGMLLATFVAAGAVSASAATHHKGTKSASAAGTIESFDASGHMLSLKTSKGTESFKLGDGAQVWIGSKSGSSDDLGKYTGDRATVKYTASGGEKLASTVRVTVPAGGKSKS